MSVTLDPIVVSRVIAVDLATAIDALKKTHPGVVGTLSVLLEVEQDRLRHLESLKKFMQACEVQDSSFPLTP